MKRYINFINVDLLDTEALSQLYDKPLTHQYIKITLKGQSFIYHQIRKMMGVMIQKVQQDQPEDFVEKCLSEEKVKVWLAPSEGLLLNRLYFEEYNRRRNIIESLKLSDEEEAVNEDFKRKNLYKCMIACQEDSNIFTDWLCTNIWYDNEDKKKEAGEEPRETGEDKMVAEGA